MPETIHPHARRVLAVVKPKLEATPRGKTGADDAGEFSGYLAVWGNVDNGRETIDKGAFAKSAAQRVPAKKVPVMIRHFCYGGDTVECVGTVVEAKEDDYGLYVRGIFSSVPLAQETRTKILEGHVQGLSVGYRPIRYEFRPLDPNDPNSKQILAHLECQLLEATITVRPMNELAGITSAKTEAPDTGKEATGNADKPAPAPAPKPTVSISAKCNVELNKARAFLSSL
jgi:HK97 family phage prohead protease